MALDPIRVPRFGLNGGVLGEGGGKENGRKREGRKNGEVNFFHGCWVNVSGRENNLEVSGLLARSELKGVVPIAIPQGRARRSARAVVKVSH